ncbi:hypothetical protein [Chroococcidiopsis thermalis]|uniref:hypothetical protein n=1 Tax=Chroococcidiopsis thermalis TaxID=54299 RepID=UPI0002EACA0F|nr:hypothetical protein [Chroococcidiopsis thermalis]
MCAGVQGGEERVAERKIAQGRAWEKLPLARAQERLSPITHYQLPTTNSLHRRYM